MNNTILKENKFWDTSLHIPWWYGVVGYYSVKNECPHCKSKLVMTWWYHWCRDWEWTTVDTFTCENKCLIKYTEILDYNWYKD